MYSYTLTLCGAYESVMSTVVQLFSECWNAGTERKNRLKVSSEFVLILVDTGVSRPELKGDERKVSVHRIGELVWFPES